MYHSVTFTVLFLADIQQYAPYLIYVRDKGPLNYRGPLFVTIYDLTNEKKNNKQKTKGMEKMSQFGLCFHLKIDFFLVN